MQVTQLKDEIFALLDAKKGVDIQVIEVGEKTTLADYFIIVSGTSTPHVRAMADEVEYQLKTKHGILPKQVEGQSTGRWILMDYLDVVVHIFHEEEREFYSLEKLWQGMSPA